METKTKLYELKKLQSDFPTVTITKSIEVKEVKLGIFVVGGVICYGTDAMNYELRKQSKNRNLNQQTI